MSFVLIKSSCTYEDESSQYHLDTTLKSVSFTNSTVYHRQSLSLWHIKKTITNKPDIKEKKKSICQRSPSWPSFNDHSRYMRKLWHLEYHANCDYEPRSKSKGFMKGHEKKSAQKFNRHIWASGNKAFKSVGTFMLFLLLMTAMH